MKLLDLSGKRFGKLTVDFKTSNPNLNCTNTEAFWLCVCDCGGTAVVSSYRLRTHHTKSCGCLRIENGFKLGRSCFIHGGQNNPTWISWRAMMQRCYAPKNKDYHNYGGRGIRVCERWHNFQYFLMDMGERPEGLTLDRKNNDVDYSKDNCRWATRLQQAQNRRYVKT